MHPADRDKEASACSTFVAVGRASPTRTILLVEDEGFVREAACKILSDAGYRVLKAGSAVEALRVFRDHAGAVQLLLTDVVLPDRSCCYLAMALLTVCAGVKTIFISGHPENLITKQGLRGRGWTYLPKPFSAASLIQKVKEALSDENVIG